ncbi:TetR/AcrR family transcriptional regulator [Catenuloplanes atrovinosus]|uniref:AcrR family transcriptional regulator n=1 Tax=Catenuloplanes atrovinosus TaxID=137266 RepID=A0AAE3YPN3_9ACTN|nr:TetR/AcrR family transcriptional regulator [Catenuloplanes atrovinosus]MDR7276340.1 AcrR family transcriptional regulator [Catenuloplanes atrovinosus]
MTGQRADARRNYALLLAVASEAVAAHGADASLEQIARTAGVGSGTVRRHFPTRHALLAAVFRERVESLCAAARDLSGRLPAREALLEWLRLVTASAATIGGLATALNRDRVAAPGEPHTHCATTQLTSAGAPLVARATAAGALTPGVTISDLLTLVTGISLAAAPHPDPAAEAERLLALTVAGISPVP